MVIEYFLQVQITIKNWEAAYKQVDGQAYRVDCIYNRTLNFTGWKRLEILGSSNTYMRQVQHCRLLFVSVGHRLACNTIANLSGGQLGLNVGIVSIPPDTYSAAATFVSFVSQRLLLWPSLLCLSRNTICRDHPPHIYPDHPVASWPHSPYQPLINGWHAMAIVISIKGQRLNSAEMQNQFESGTDAN